MAFRAIALTPRENSSNASTLRSRVTAQDWRRDRNLAQPAGGTLTWRGIR